MATKRTFRQNLLIYIAVAILSLFVIAKTFKAISSYRIMKRELKDLKTKVVQDSIFMDNLRMLNDNCSEQATSQARHYERKIKALYNTIDNSKSDIQGLQEKKEAVDSMTFKKETLLDYINKKF